MATRVTGPTTVVGPTVETYDVGENSQLVAVVYVDVIPSNASARYPGSGNTRFDENFYLTAPEPLIPMVAFGSDDINQEVNGDNDHRFDTLRAWRAIRWRRASYEFDRLGLETDSDFGLYVPDGFEVRYWLFR